VTSEKPASAKISVIAFTLVSFGTDESLINWENIWLFLDASTTVLISDATLSNTFDLAAVRNSALA
jgi:hypothetical protein